MPYVGRDIEPARKRRWQDDEDGTIFTLYRSEDEDNYEHLGQQHQYPSRKILPLSKRAKLAEDVGYESDFSLHCRNGTTLQKPPQRSLSLDSRLLNKETQNPLQPCHICHRRPTKKSDLDSFADCHGCEERTCFICLRECHGRDADRATSVLSEQEALSRSFHMEDADDATEAVDGDGCDKSGASCNLDGLDTEPTENATNKDKKGWRACGHRSVVCSRCCVERGVEGEVVCLGCLSGIDFR